MIRGTTVQFKFSIPRNFSELETVRIVFWQNGNTGPSLDCPLPIIKIKDQCVVLDSEQEFYVTLDEEETLRFTDKKRAYVQFQGRAQDGIVYASKIREITVYPTYGDSVLGTDIIPTPTVNDQNIES